MIRNIPDPEDHLRVAEVAVDPPGDSEIATPRHLRFTAIATSIENPTTTEILILQEIAMKEIVTSQNATTDGIHMTLIIPLGTTTDPHIPQTTVTTEGLLQECPHHQLRSTKTDLGGIYLHLQQELLGSVMWITHGYGRLANVLDNQARYSENDF